MGFNLNKGGKFQISKGIGSVLVGCGWTPAAKAGEAFDLDSHAFALVHPGNSPEQATFYSPSNGCYPLALTYANADEMVKATDVGAKAFRSADGSMVHLGDNRTGVGEGDDEQMKLALNQLPADVAEVAIWVTIHEAGKRKQTFQRVEKPYVRVLDSDSGEELCKYPLNEKFASAKSVHVGSLVRSGTGWQFEAVGAGVEVELGEILGKYAG